MLMSLQNRIQEKDLVLKGLSYLSDLSTLEMPSPVIDGDWCNLLKTESLYEAKKDLDTIDRLARILADFNAHCGGDLARIGFIQKWLKSARFQLWKLEDESDDFKSVIDKINQLLATLKEEL